MQNKYLERIITIQFNSILVYIVQTYSSEAYYEVTMSTQKGTKN
jgi:hypothetical protein